MKPVPPPIDIAGILSPQAREMFAKELIPYFEARVPGAADTLDPGYIMLWLLEEVQRLRGHVADLKQAAAAGGTRILPLRRPP